MNGKQDPITRFLSEETVARHREHLRQIRLRYSILQKSETILKNPDIREIPWQKLSPDLRQESFSYLAQMELHDTFFSSFTDLTFLPLPGNCLGYTNTQELLNHLYRLGRDGVGGFLAVYKIGRKILAKRLMPPYRELLTIRPLLAIDLAEHTYFSDYSFDKERYLLSALPHLDISRLG